MVYGNLAGRVVFWDLTNDRVFRLLDAIGEAVDYASISPDGRSAATVSERPCGGIPLRIWDVESGRLLGRLATDISDRMPESVFLDDGRLLLFEWRWAELRGVARLLRLDPRGGEPSVVHHWTFLGEPAALPGAKFMILCRDDGQLTRVDLNSGEPAWSRSVGPTPPRQTRISPDGSRFALIWENRIAVCDCRDGRELVGLPMNFEPSEVFLGREAKTFAIGRGNEGVSIHDLARDVPSRSFYPWDDRVFALGHTYAGEISPDGRRLAIAGWKSPGGASPATLRDTATGLVLATCPYDLRQPGKLTFIDGGRSVLIVGQSELIRWFLPGGPDRGGQFRLEGHKDEAWSLAFDSTGALLLSGCDDSDDPNTLKVWDQDTGRKVLDWKPQRGTVSALATSPDGRLLVTGSLTERENLRLWNAEPLREGKTPTLEAALEGPVGFVRVVAFSRDGRLLAAAGNDRIVRVWEIPARRLLRSFTGHERKVRDLAFSPDGRRLASASDDSMIRVWNMAEGSCERALLRPTEQVAVAFTPDGETLVGAQQGGRVTLWDVETGAVKRTLPVEDRELRCLAITPDGLSLAV